MKNHPGFLTARVDFIGRAQSLWSPRALETLAFSRGQRHAGPPDLDPIASLHLGMTLAAEPDFQRASSDRHGEDARRTRST